MTRTGLHVAGLIVALVLAACAPQDVVESLPGPSASWTPGLRARQDALDGARLERGARGALAVVRDGGETWRITSGTADGAGSLVSTDMRFRIGSITKPIVAALALMVAAVNSTDDQAGLIDFSKQLLCHSSTTASAPTHPSGG